MACGSNQIAQQRCTRATVPREAGTTFWREPLCCMAAARDALLTSACPFTALCLWPAASPCALPRPELQRCLSCEIPS
jgi:hypothetical protein